MVNLIKEEKKEFSADRITQEKFLASLNKWYKNNGVKIGIEKVYDKVKQTKWGNSHLFILKCSILDDMPKCWARVIDQNGKIEYSYDEYKDEKIEKREIIDDADTVTLFLEVKYGESVNNYDGDDELFCSNLAASYKMVKPILIAEELIPTDVTTSISFNVDEIINDLQGLEFICKAGKNKNGRLIPVFEVVNE